MAKVKTAAKKAPIKKAEIIEPAKPVVVVEPVVAEITAPKTEDKKADETKQSEGSLKHIKKESEYTPTEFVIKEMMHQKGCSREAAIERLKNPK